VQEIQKIDFKWDTEVYLNEKSKEIIAGGLPFTALADDIAFNFDKLDEEIRQLETYRKVIDTKIKELKANKTKTSSEVAKWLLDNGERKIAGEVVSSITIKDGTPKTTKKVTKFIPLYPKDTMEEVLVSKGLGRFEETTEDVSEKPTTIRINKRKAK